LKSKLSQAVKDDTTSIRDTLPILQKSNHTIEANVDTLHTKTQAVKDDTTSIRDTQSQQQDIAIHKTISEWLSPLDSPAQQHDIISRRHDGTGEWFLWAEEFKRWSDGSSKTLFCPGIPGAGKTMIAAIAIDHLNRTACNDTVGVAYLFFNYKGQANQSSESLFAALLKQLVQSRPGIAAPVRAIYDEHSKRNSRPSIKDLLGALQSVCLSYTTVFIVVDALDECADRDGTRSRLIDELLKLQATIDLRLLFTSRAISDIFLKFQSIPVLEVQASKEDVGSFVAGQIPRLPKCIQRDEDLRSSVQTKIVEAVDGM
jgi:Cdc6-like AAA superfamily ATPase